MFEQAEEVGLDGLYRIVYPFLSAYSHPTTRPFDQLFDDSGRMRHSRIPRRNVYEERILAPWEFWFELRVLTLAGRAYGRNWEYVSDELVANSDKEVGFSTAVFVRERLREGQGPELS